MRSGYLVSHTAAGRTFETIVLDSTTPLNACVRAVAWILQDNPDIWADEIALTPRSVIRPITEAAAFARAGIIERRKS